MITKGRFYLTKKQKNFGKKQKGKNDVTMGSYDGA